MSIPSADLAGLLDLERLDLDLYRGRQPDTDLQRTFGGQVAAQALMAGLRTVEDDLAVHSLHSYFLLPGDPATPIIYDVQRLRDGRSFSTRRIVARQHGRGIFFMAASFQVPEEGLEHQDRMPDVPPPEESPRLLDLARNPAAAAVLAREWASLDIRYAGDPAHPEHNASGSPVSRHWIRIAADLPRDPELHVSAFTYASDLTLLAATLVGHGVGISSPKMQNASLDHAIWFHRPFLADQWWLYDQWSPAAVGGRGLAWARVFTRDGTLVANTAQEGLIRWRGPGAPGGS